MKFCTLKRNGDLLDLISITIYDRKKNICSNETGKESTFLRLDT